MGITFWNNWTAAPDLNNEFVLWEFCCEYSGRTVSLSIGLLGVGVVIAICLIPPDLGSKGEH